MMLRPNRMTDRSRERCPRPIHGRGPRLEERRWVVEKGATRATNPGVRCPGMGAVVVFFPRSDALMGLPTLRPPRLRYLGTVAVDEAWTTPPGVVKRAEGVTRDGRGRSRERCPRPIHGRGPPVRRAAVGRRWATRATNHESGFPGIGPVGVSFPVRSARPERRKPHGACSSTSNAPMPPAGWTGCSPASTRVVCVCSAVALSIGESGYGGHRDEVPGRLSG